MAAVEKIPSEEVVISMRGEILKHKKLAV